jgi:hypothetical protein
MRRRHSLIGAMMIHKGDADGMICGTFGTTQLHLHFIDQVLGRARRRLRLRGDELPDPAGAPAGDGRHPRQREPDAKNWPRSRSWRPRK